ncbi:jg17236 [Pararge aegeria aegeria]|uniref:Jg17236 protein n=1 Tax=Pararge aegeria aegeria TaxID=348720 RepID=A0A8S4QWA3_9NEOP|nr:jg17236 [Pararge aegeria aegeria]
MDHAVNENDIHRQIAGFNFDKPIKVTCIIMDDETDNAKNPLDPFKPVKNAASQVINNTNSDTLLLNTSARHENDVNFNEKRANIGHEPHKVADEAMQYDRNVKNTKNVPNYYEPKSLTTLRKQINMVSSMTNHIHFTPDEKKLYLSSIDSVSKNLINVTKYYHFYNMRYMENHSVKEKYIDYKYRYYSLSYNIVVSIILPQEHNQTFIDNFILRTIELGNREGWYNLMNVEALGALVKDMIKWAKRRKMYQEEHEHYLRHLMCGQPVPPVATVSSSNNMYDVNTQQQLPRLPQVSASSCPPALTRVSPTLPIPSSSNRNINVNTPYPMTRAPAELLPAPPTPPVPSISNNISHAYKNQQINSLPTVSPTHQLNRQPSVSPSQQLSRPPPVSPTKQLNRRPQVPSIQQLNRLPTISPTQQLYRPPPAYPIQQLSRPPDSTALSVQKSHQQERAPPEGHKNNICLFTTGPPGSAISISIDPSVAKTVSAEKVRKNAQNPESKKRKTHDNPRNGDILVTNDTWYPPMQNHLPHNNYSANYASRTSTADVMNTAIEPVNNQSQFTDEQIDNELDNDKCQPLLSRSVSRDSGFGSPVLCSLLTNNDYNMAYPSCTDNQDFTPNIAHVTSLNPGALHIASGSCKICGSTTKNVCIVCYNEYYCGYVCQNIDWPVHKEICRGQ